MALKPSHETRNKVGEVSELSNHILYPIQFRVIYDGESFVW